MAYAIDGESVVVSSSALPTGAATAAKQLPDGHNVVVTASALPTGAATAAKQLADGHNVVPEDPHGHKAEFTFMRDMKVAEPFRLVGAAFVGTTLDTSFWTASVGATGTVTQIDHDVTLTTSTTANSFANLSSVRIARFVFAHPHICRIAARNPVVAVANNTRRWGAYTHTAGVPQNGYYFEVSPAGVLSVNSAKAGTPSSVASGSFNGDQAAYTVDVNLHAYEIHYFVMKVEFYVDGILLHTLTPTTTNIIGDQNLNASATSMNNATGGTVGAVDIHAATIIRTGKNETQPTHFYQAGTVAAQILKRGPGLLHSIAISGVVNNSVIALWDGLTAAGPSTLVYSTGSMANNSVPFTVDLHSVAYYNGLTLAITTANANATVIYE